MMTAGVTPSGTGLDQIAWDILGQTYRPVARSDAAFAFDTLFPPGTFVPPHIHTTQDEFIRVLEGSFELWLEGETQMAHAGDLVRLPMGGAHGIFNKTDAPVRALFWVAPSMRLFDLFTKLDGLKDVAEVVRVSAEHDVNFLPPPG